MEKIAFVYETKKGNDIFKIGGITYIIIHRFNDEIGSQGNYAKKILYKIKDK